MGLNRKIYPPPITRNMLIVSMLQAKRIYFSKVVAGFLVIAVFLLLPTKLRNNFETANFFVGKICSHGVCPHVTSPRRSDPPPSGAPDLT